MKKLARPKRKHASARDGARKNLELGECHGRSQIRQPSRREYPGDASDFIMHLPDLLTRGEQRPVVLYCRETNYNGKQERRLDDQMNDAICRLSAFGIRLNRRLVIFDCCGERGYMDEPRLTLIEAIEYAHQNDAILVAPTRCRLIRHHRFDGRWNSSERPTVEEYEKLLEMADGVPLATIYHPDSSSKKEQIARGQSIGKGKGGRPKGSKSKKPGHKKERRKMYSKRALRLWEKDRSLREIGKELGVAHSTIQGWIEMYF